MWDSSLQFIIYYRREIQKTNYFTSFYIFYKSVRNELKLYVIIYTTNKFHPAIEK